MRELAKHVPIGDSGVEVESMKWYLVPVVWFIAWAVYHEALRQLEAEGIIRRYSMPDDWFLWDPLAKAICK